LHNIDLSNSFCNFNFIIMADAGISSQASSEALGTQPEHSKADTGRFSNADKSSHTAIDPNIVDFGGPDDPDNAMNWSWGKKAAAIGMVTAMTLFSYVPFSIR
jgi:hypothetical protein